MSRELVEKGVGNIMYDVFSENAETAAINSV